MATETMVPFTLDDYFRTTALGSINKAIGNNLYGINHRQIATSIPSNKDLYGLTFFVRPQLNLQSENIRNNRLFYPLLSKEANSIQRFVRCTLDPRLMYGYGDSQETAAIKCPVVDSKNAFIPILSNNLKSISGWPDVVVPTFDSKEGLMNEIYSQVDGMAKNYGAFDIDATFRNTIGDPIVYMFYIWLHYQANVFSGNMVPYPDFIIENAIDYNTRIYRLVLDHRRRYVKKIAATGVSFPVSVPAGQFFDYTDERPYNDQSKDITIRLRSLGAQYHDDILIHEFNQTVIIFNPDMKDENRTSSYYKIDPALLIYFNNRGYPRINPETYELEWWINYNTFKNRINSMVDHGFLDSKYSESTGS